METIILPFRIFQLFCISPLKLVTSKTLLPEDTKFWFTATVFVFAIHLTVFIHGLIASDVYMDWSDTAFKCFIKLELMTTIRFLTLIILLESLIKRRKQIAFFKRVQKIDKMLTDNLKFDASRHSVVRYKNNRFTFLWLAIFGAHSAVSVYSASNPRDINFRLLYVPPLFVGLLLYLQFILYVGIIRCRFEAINQIIQDMSQNDDGEFFDRSVLNSDLLKLVESFSHQATSIEKSSLAGKLHDLSEIYQLLFECNELVNNLFQWSTPIGVAIGFTCILINLYWTLLWLLQPRLSLLLLTLPAFTGTIYHFSYIVLMSNECHYTVEEVVDWMWVRFIWP